MKKSTYTLTIFSLLFVLLLGGCSSGPNPNLPDPGFTIVTQRRNSLGIESRQPNTAVFGNQTRPTFSDARGNVRTFRGITSPTVGLLPVPDGVAPAFWELGEESGPCLGQVTFGEMKRADFNYLTCAEFRLEFPLAFLPSSGLMSGDPTLVWTVTGTGMNTNYGMPMLQVYDVFGNVVAYVQATDCGYTPETDTTPEITWMSGNSSALAGLASGSYTADIWNQTPDGTGAYVGFVDFTIYGNEPPPSPDPCWGYEGMGNGC